MSISTQTPFDLAQPENPSPQVKLFGANDEPIDLEKISAGRKEAFDFSFLDCVGDWLAKHGPALAKLLLIIGSGAGTIYNAIKAGNLDGVHIGWIVTLILAAAGLIVEIGFAYAWKKRGAYELAGVQRKTADQIFKRSSTVMIGDLSLSVAEIAFGVGGIATYWIGLIQPIMAVHIVMLFYRLKGEHPMYLAEIEIVDLKAGMQAAKIRDLVNDQRLQLAERNHERSLQWASLRKRHEHGTRLVTGRWFDRQIKRAVKEQAGQKLWSDSLGKLKRLPELLSLPTSRKN